VRAEGANNEAAAFVQMVREHDRGLRMLAYRLLRDREVMDDVMQDAYLRAFRAMSGFRGDANVRTWLYRITYNACMDRLRSDRRRQEVSLEALVEVGVRKAGGTVGAMANQRTPWTATGSAEDPEESVLGRDELASALALLPAEQRAAVLLVDAIGLAHEEAAQVLGVRPGTIASRLHYARSSLRATLRGGVGHEET
jgi:RNA polymerase sigma-70 factor (ECF subfamily)